jgi:site-specific DNA-methyltransferase (adenine-specific)
MRRIYTVNQADVIDWATGYTGEPFHALLCDPPYEYGFMGKSWDATGISYRKETWEAYLRILCPGGFGMAFGGARTAHRLAVAIEDAGFVIHPQIAWIYGCLSDDTEILTRRGWARYDRLFDGCMVMCYNVNSGTLNFLPVEKVCVYEYDDIAYHIVSERTDQIVSRNHRCLVERDNRFVFRAAETLECQEILPILESVQEVREAIFSKKRKGILQENYLRTLLLQNGNRTATANDRSARKAQNYNDSLRGMWKEGNEAKCVGKEGKIANVLQSLQWNIARERFIAIFGKRTKWLDRRKSCLFSAENVGRKQSCLERWRYLFLQARKLCADKICAVSRRIFTYGAQRWLCYGTPSISCANTSAVSKTRGNCPSYQPQSSGQSLGKSTVIRQQLGTQEIRTLWRTISDLATINSIQYKGTVWCVKVPTGAFVARRNGKVFITGNSGFPKATRLDARIDEQAGAAREEVGTVRRWGANAGKGRGNQYANEYEPSEPGAEKYDPITAPTTPLAQAWAGHRYGLQALKPALEPIVVFQKPYEGKPIDCITRTGAGALNIEGSRIGTEPVISNRWTDNAHPFGGGAGNPYETVHNRGRWPANVVLSHLPDCGETCVPGCPVKALGEQSGVLTSGKPAGLRHAPNNIYGEYGTEIPVTGYGDSGSAARFFYNADWMYERLEKDDGFVYCAKANKNDRDAGLDSMPLRQKYAKDGRGNSHEIFTSASAHDSSWAKKNPAYPQRNHHPAIKPIALVRHLATLLLPPAMYSPRRIVVPFCGSGSEMIGCLRAGWEVIEGIEKESEYCDIARARLEYWAKIPIQRELPLNT